MLDTYSNIDNEELSHKIKQLISKHPNSGYRRMHSLLMSEGIKVSVSRICVTMQKVDPEGVLTRAMQLTTEFLLHIVVFPCSFSGYKLYVVELLIYMNWTELN